jgi:hypothetical protein
MRHLSNPRGIWRNCKKTHDDDLSLIENLRRNHDKSSKIAEDLRANNADLARSLRSWNEKFKISKRP